MVEQVIPDAGKLVELDRAVLIHRRATVADIAERFARNYAHYKTAPWKNDEPIASIVQKLKALDVATCDYSEIKEAIGTDWTNLDCDICGKSDCETVARIGDEPDYEARWQDICLPCLTKLGAWAESSDTAKSEGEV